MLKQLDAKNKYLNIIICIAGCVLLAVFSFQYPASSKLPLGNDAPTHIQRAHYPLSAPLHSGAEMNFSVFKSTYPLSTALFSLSRIIPVSWPMRFMIWMALGHLLTGLLLYYLVNKISGTIPAFIATIMWAVSAIGVLSFVQVGFLPQLWSMIFLLLFFERLHAKSIIGIGISFIAMWFAHPGTFIVCALSLAIILPQYVFSKLHLTSKNKYLSEKITISIISLLILVFIMIVFKRWPTYITAEKEFDVFRTIPEILKSQIGIIMPFSPIGLIVFLRNSIQPKFFRFFLTTFGIISIILAFNSLLGIGVLENRFLPFAIISIIIFGSIGLWKCLKTALPFFPLRYVTLASVLLITTFQGWHTAGAFFADPNIDKTYQQIQENQMIVFNWIRQNLPTNAIIAHNDSLMDGVIRWLPAISERGSIKDNFLNTDSCPTIMKHVVKSDATHILYFKKFEYTPNVYETNPQLFKKVYDTKEATIFELPVRQALNAEQMKINPDTLCAN